MIRLAALSLLLIAAAPADVLTIGGQRFPQSDIVDARAVGDASGPAIYITFNLVATARMARLTKTLIGKPMRIAFGRKTISSPIVMEPIDSGTVQLAGGFKSFEEARVLALRISGKPPLPESLAD